MTVRSSSSRGSIASAASTGANVSTNCGISSKLMALAASGPLVQHAVARGRPPRITTSVPVSQGRIAHAAATSSTGVPVGARSPSTGRMSHTVSGVATSASGPRSPSVPSPPWPSSMATMASTTSVPAAPSLLFAAHTLPSRAVSVGCRTRTPSAINSSVQSSSTNQFSQSGTQFGQRSAQSPQRLVTPMPLTPSRIQAASAQSSVRAVSPAATAARLANAAVTAAVATANSNGFDMRAQSAPHQRASNFDVSTEQVPAPQTQEDDWDPDSSPTTHSAGSEVTIGDHRFRRTSVLGRGSYSEVWRADVLGAGPSLPFAATSAQAAVKEAALKEVRCSNQMELQQAIFEVQVLLALEKTTLPGTSGEPLRIPRCLAYKVDPCANGWLVRTAMTVVPGEPLDCFVRRPPVLGLGRVAAYRRGAHLAGKLIRDIGPTLEQLAPIAWHRDVNSHNVLIDGVPPPEEDSGLDVTPNVAFWLIDFGLAIDSQSWVTENGRWKTEYIGGDSRYWPPSSWIMHLLGPDGFIGRENLCEQYQRRLDIHGLGITALELLCTVALSPGEAIAERDPNSASWAEVFQMWQQYRDNVWEWWAAVYSVFSAGGDIAPVQAKLLQENVIEQLISLLSGTRAALRNCAAQLQDEADQTAASVLTIIADMIDEDCNQDLTQMRQRLIESERPMRVTAPEEKQPQITPLRHMSPTPQIGQVLPTPPQHQSLPIAPSGPPAPSEDSSQMTQPKQQEQLQAQVQLQQPQQTPQLQSQQQFPFARTSSPTRAAATPIVVRTLSPLRGTAGPQVLQVPQRPYRGDGLLDASTDSVRPGMSPQRARSPLRQQTLPLPSPHRPETYVRPLSLQTSPNQTMTSVWPQWTGVVLPTTVPVTGPAPQPEGGPAFCPSPRGGPALFSSITTSSAGGGGSVGSRSVSRPRAVNNAASVAVDVEIVGQTNTRVRGPTPTPGVGVTTAATVGAVGGVFPLGASTSSLQSQEHYRATSQEGLRRHNGGSGSQFRYGNALFGGALGPLGQTTLSPRDAVASATRAGVGAVSSGAGSGDAGGGACGSSSSKAGVQPWPLLVGFSSTKDRSAVTGDGDVGAGPPVAATTGGASAPGLLTPRAFAEKNVMFPHSTDAWRGSQPVTAPSSCGGSQMGQATGDEHERLRERIRSLEESLQRLERESLERAKLGMERLAEKYLPKMGSQSTQPSANALYAAAGIGTPMTGAAVSAVQAARQPSRFLSSISSSQPGSAGFQAFTNGGASNAGSGGVDSIVQ